MRMGAIVNRTQYDSVLAAISRAQQEGAHLLTGGARPLHLGPRGYYIQPTVFQNVSDRSHLWRTEIFGPVLAVSTFRTEEEAVQRANASAYGLAGAVISPSRRVCERVARQLQCGIVWVNCSQPCFPQLPWGGVKGSGVGGRDLGREGLEGYQTPKQIVTYVSEETWPWFRDGVATGMGTGQPKVPPLAKM